ncbi:MAG: cytochrome P450 [Woeseiaceae bacterium]
MSDRSWAYPFSTSSNPNTDLSSQDAFNEGGPWATFERMRKEDPVAWCEEENGKGFWSITRHEDVLRLNKDFKALSSAKGIRMEDQSEDEYEARKTFQETDPPKHTYFRMLLNHAFSRKQVANFEDQIRAITVELIDKCLEMGDFDAVHEIARQLPMRMLGQILGVPEEDTVFLVEKGDALISNADPEYTDFVVDKVDTEEYRLLPFRSPAAIELFDYANGLLERIRAGEQVGVLNLILEPTKDGSVMSDDEFRNFFCLAVAAGNDTTRFSISATLHALANKPGMLEQVRDLDEAGLNTAIDEMVRWASPTTHFRRTATKDFDYGGKSIKEGDKVILWFLSANRDSEIFDDPYEIDLARKPNRFMSFGQGGPHVCLGMFLAKLELKVVLQEMAKRVETVEQTSPHAFLRSNFMHGIKRLPLRISARAQ